MGTRFNKYLSKVDFRTQPDIFETLETKFGPFNVDVAASHENALCRLYYTKEENALEMSWPRAVWCNPPYNNIEPWVDKGLEELAWGDATSITFLLPNSTCTQWFKKLWEHPYLSDLVFITGRLKFRGPHVHPDIKKASAPQGSIVVHLKRQEYKFAKVELVDRSDLEEGFYGVDS